MSEGHTLDEIPATIYHGVEKNFPNDLVIYTGSEAHVKKILDKIKTKKQFSSERSIYAKAGLSFIIPEMREDVAERNLTGNPRN